jgi:hypothetical protein
MKILKTILLAVMIAVTSVMCVNVFAETDPSTTPATTDPATTSAITTPATTTPATTEPATSRIPEDITDPAITEPTTDPATTAPPAVSGSPTTTRKPATTGIPEEVIIPGSSDDPAPAPEKFTQTINEDYYVLKLSTTPDLIKFPDYYDPEYQLKFTPYTYVLVSNITDNFFTVKNTGGDIKTDYTFTMEVTTSKTYETTHEIYQQLIDEFIAAHNVPNTFELITDYSDVYGRNNTTTNRHYIQFTCQNGELFRQMWSMSNSDDYRTTDYPSYLTFSEKLVGRIYELSSSKKETLTVKSYEIQLKDNINTDSEANYICQLAKAIPGVTNAEYVHVQTTKDVEYTALQLEIMKKSPMAVDFMSDTWYLDRVMPRYDWYTVIAVEFEKGYGRYDDGFEERLADLNANKDTFVRALPYTIIDKNGDVYYGDALLFGSFDDAYNALSKFADVNDRGDYWDVVDNAFKVIEGNKYHITHAYFNEFDDNGCYIDEDVIRKYLTPAEIAENLDEINAYLASKNLREMTVPGVIGNANENLSREQIALIRNAHETPDNAFMPDKWFVERTGYSFSDSILVYFVDGYELDPMDFYDGSIPEFKRVPEFDEQYGEGAYMLTYRSYSSLVDDVNFLEPLYPDKIARVVDLTSFPDKEYKPTGDDIKKYGTIGLSAEEVAELWETFGITPDPGLYGDADNDGKIQLNDIVILSRAVASENLDNVLTPQGKANADVYADGKIDSTDISVFANALVNSKLSDLPIVG